MSLKEFEKVKWEKHETNTDFIKLDFGEEIKGVYVGKEESERFPNTFIYQLEVEEEGKKVIKKISGTVIANHFEDIEFGTPVKIVYKGKVKNYHDYDVYVGKNEG